MKMNKVLSSTKPQAEDEVNFKLKYTVGLRWKLTPIIPTGDH